MAVAGLRWPPKQATRKCRLFWLGDASGRLGVVGAAPGLAQGLGGGPDWAAAVARHRTCGRRLDLPDMLGLLRTYRPRIAHHPQALARRELGSDVGIPASQVLRRDI